MDKIKAFFQNKVVKVIAWVVLALDVIALIIGGATQVEITDAVGLVAGIVGAFALLIVFIAERVSKK